MVHFREHGESLTAKDFLKKAAEDLERDKKSELLTKQQERIQKRVVSFFERAAGADGSYESAKSAFEEETERYENRTDEVSLTLQNVFDFMEAAFGDGQEMVAFITELNASYYSLWFIRENGSDQYYRHNKGLLFDDRQKLILGQMEEAENLLGNGIK